MIGGALLHDEYCIRKQTFSLTSIVADVVVCVVIAVDGLWSEWAAWSSCSASCGGNGREVRQRSCSNPAPSNGGKDCSGGAEEERACQQTPPDCPGECVTSCFCLS